jgi:flagellin
MANVDVTRVAGNIGALNALNSLTAINKELAIHQTRLASGKMINDAADDPSGNSMATTFDVRRLGLKTVLNGIGDAKNLLSTASGGLQKIQDILVTMKNKALQGKSDTIGNSERDAIAAQLNAYSKEIEAIVDQTQWNGGSLIGASGSAGAQTAGLNFLTSDNAANATTLFQFTNNQGFGAFGTTSSDGLQLNPAYDRTMLYNGTALTEISAAIDKVKIGISDVGSFSARLGFKEDAMTVQYTNTEAAYNRLMNANMAEEQVDASKLLILQQTATAELAQANTAPQFLLSLFR